MAEPMSGGVGAISIPACRKCLDFALGRPLAAGDDRPGMAHALSRRGGEPGDEPRHRLGHLRANKIGGLLFGRSPDLTDNQHPLGGRIGLKHPQSVHETGAIHRISPDAQRGGLPQSQVGQLVHRFVGERPRPADHSHFSLSVNVSGHDPQLALTGSDHPRAVRAQQTGGARLQIALHGHHVVDRHPFGDTHNQFHSRLRRLHDGIRGKRGRDEDQGGMGAGGIHRFAYPRKQGQVHGEGVRPSRDPAVIGCPP